MISFSVNSCLDKDKAKKVAKLVKEMNSYNADYVGEAYIHLMTGRKNNNVSLNNYAKAKKKEEVRDVQKYDRNEENLIESEDLEQGLSGTDFRNICDDANYEDMSIDMADIDYYVDSFLDIREFIYFKGGHDIWRLLELADRKDKQALIKLRMILDEYHIGDFIYEFLSCPYNLYRVKQILG